MEKHEKRINIEIPLPSISLKRFIEKAVKDDDFFSFSLENPLGAMKECGVKIEISKFIPSDFANFFGALSSLRELVKEKGIEDLSFEGIFGKPIMARPGTILQREITQGFYREWDLKKANIQKEKCFSTDTKFEEDTGRGAKSVRDLCQSQEVQIPANIQFFGETQQRAEQVRGQNTDWQNDHSAVQDKRANTSYNRNFETDGKRSLEDILSGPLLHPDDLASITARIDTFTSIRKQTDM